MLWNINQRIWGLFVLFSWGFFFGIWLSNCSTTSLKRLYFLNCLAFASLLKISCTCIHESISQRCNYSIHLFVYLYTKLHYLHYCSFVRSLRSSSQFSTLSFCKALLPICGLLHSHKNFKISSSISTKQKLAGVFMAIALNPHL